MGDGKFVRVTVTVPKSLLEEVEEVCEEYGYTRSELFRIAIRRFITYLRMGQKEVGVR
ncbi:MAG: hypothetical protein DRJ96_05790 [Thermoprotei archaeon]|nr:MAG: hypothetical protein DRJ96_05790 [Thermoprotei archaeon]